MENKYPVETIIAEDVPVWQFLRNIYADVLYKSHFSFSPQKKTKRLTNLIKVLPNYFWEKQNKKNDYSAILFTDTLEERTIDGLISDKIAHNILMIMQNHILVVLDPLGERHKSVSKYFHSDFLSIYRFVLPAKLFWHKLKIHNSYILDEIESDIGIKINYVNCVNQFFRYVKVFHKWLIITRPKVIYVNCYFSLKHQALIYAAKLNNVITVELQHGIISKAQTAYAQQKKMGRHSFPDYLLSFGEIEKSQVSPYFVSLKNIFPIGNYYLEYINSKKTNPKIENFFMSLRNNYNKIVIISAQELIEQKLISFLSEAATKLPDVAFLLFLRKRNAKKISLTISKQNNLLIPPNFDLYECCNYCDYHTTVFSTFAIEALFLGVPTIFININSLSEEFYSELLTKHIGVKCANNIKEYTEIVENWKIPTNIKKQSKKYFSDNNYNQINSFINSHL